ncbi:MAG: hypothetical protein GEU81_11495 [Nitriliruptorales bacterium]|nr:hypothetical protein [Nitriliruptorales bacterium]
MAVADRVAFGDPVLRWTAVLSLGSAGVLHAAVVAPHYGEWAAAAWFFVVLEATQIGLGVALAARPSRVFCRAAIAVSAGALTVWGVSRTVGMPFGPEAGVVGPVGFVDLVTAVLELLTIAVLVLVLRAPGNAGGDYSGTVVAQIAMIGVCITALTLHAMSEGVVDHPLAADPPAVAETPEQDDAPGDEQSETVGIPSGSVDALTARTEADATAQLTAVTLEAQTSGYDRPELDLPAGAQAVLSFTNSDTEQHNVSLYTTDDVGTVFRGAFIDGGQSIDYPFTVPDAGEYRYLCDLHPWMDGTLTATP